MSTDLDGLNLFELLDLLQPVSEPPAIAMTPQTPGWILMGLALVVLVVWGVRHVHARYRAGAYRRAALAELPDTGDDAACIAALLRRTALAGFPRQAVAGLTGPDWLAFLDRSYGGTGFSHGPGQAIATAPYRETLTDPALTTLAQDWIKRHKQDLS
jgi:hypothetical protein